MDLKQLGKYEIIDKLGEGGFGAVYLANNTKLKKRVALKVLHPQVASDEMLAAYFEREALALARLEHANIVRVYDYDQIDSVNFIVMEYIEGTNLDRLLREKRVFKQDEIVSIFRQLLAALGYAHKNGVIHRDIKPSNIMLSSTNEVKITDFGIAKVAGSAKLTRTGTGAGSLLYMSPEQIKGVNIDNRSDLYSVGVTLYQVVAGRTPFEADSDYEIMTGHLEKAPLAPSHFKDSTPRELEQVILKALEKKPEKRYQSAEEMSEALAHLRASSDVTKVADTDRFARTTAVPQHPKVPSSKKKLLVPALAVLAVVVAVVAWMLMRGGEEQKPQVATFTDSLSTGKQLFVQKAYIPAAGVFSALRGSANANQTQKAEALRYESASRFLAGDTASAFTLFAELKRLDSTAIFPIEVFDPAISRAWALYNRVTTAKPSDRPDVRPMHPGGDSLGGPRNVPPRQQQGAAVGAVVVTVNNYKIFEPVTVIFDEKRERYQGEPLIFDNLAAGVYEVTVATDLGRLTNAVKVQGGREDCTFTLTENATSKLTVTSLVPDNPDDIVPAQVMIDNDRIEDAQTPFSTRLMNGPHKIWVEDRGYRTEGKPRFVNLSGDMQVEFVLRKK
jgi:serine/threonine protein kinase